MKKNVLENPVGKSTQNDLYPRNLNNVIDVKNITNCFIVRESELNKNEI